MWVLIEYIDVKSVWRKGMWRRPASKTILSSHLPTRDPRYWVWRQKPPPRALAALCHQRLLLQKGFSFYFPHFPTGLRLHGGQVQLGIHLVSAHPVPQPCYGLRYADMYLYIRFISFFYLLHLTDVSSTAWSLDTDIYVELRISCGPGLRLLCSLPLLRCDGWCWRGKSSKLRGAHLFSLFHVQCSNAQTGTDGGGRPGPGRHITTCWLS